MSLTLHKNEGMAGPGLWIPAASSHSSSNMSNLCCQRAAETKTQLVISSILKGEITIITEIDNFAGFDQEGGTIHSLVLICFREKSILLLASDKYERETEEIN